MFVGVVDGPADDGQTGGGVARLHRPGGQQGGEGLPLDVSHAEIGLAVALAGVEHGDDVGVVEPGGGAGLGLEAGQVFACGELAAQDHFQGDGPMQTPLPRPVDDAHAAAADLLKKVIIAKGSGRGGRGRRLRKFRAERAAGKVARRESFRHLHGRPQLAQLAGQLRMEGGGGVDVGVASLAGLLAQVGQEVGQPLIAVGIGRDRGDVHEADPPPGNRAARSRRIARRYRIDAAASFRPSAAAVS